MSISLNALTVFDLVVLVILLLAVIRGVWTGFMRQLAVFVGLMGGYVLAGRFSERLIPLVSQVIDQPKVVFLASYLLIFLGTMVGCMLLGKGLQKVMSFALLGWFDRLLGLLLGAAKGYFFATLLYMLLASTLSGTNDLMRKSQCIPLLQPGVSAIQQVIQDKKLRESFTPKAPAIST
ncbi:MAG: hypothetical protein BWK76_25820 [Desulfobulbaceae bacterium A2]|nr:MAG: hypothetical protein BWK76_25820 [Desulfobulbaceae bacterium A2]